MKFHLPRRVISLFLAFVLAASLVVPAAAEDPADTSTNTLTGLTLDATYISIKEGETSKLTLVGLTTSSNDRVEVKWSSNNNAALSIINDELDSCTVRAGKVDNNTVVEIMATVTVTDDITDPDDPVIKTGTASKEITVTPPPAPPKPVVTLSVLPNELRLIAGGEPRPLTAKIYENGVETSGTVTWKSENSAIATVSSTGVVTPVKKGTTSIIATYDNVSAKCFVTVNETPQQNLTVSLPSQYPAPGGNFLYPGDTFTLEATVNPSSSNLEWQIADSSLLELAEQPNGLKAVFRAKSDGLSTATSKLATVTVIAHDPSDPDKTVSARCVVTVTAANPNKINRIDLDTPTPPYLDPEDTMELSAMPSPSGSTEDLFWRSSDPKVATVVPDPNNNRKAIVTGVTPGEFKITVSTANGISATTDKLEVSGITLDAPGMKNNAFSVFVNKQNTITVSRFGAAKNGTITWTSKNPSIADASTAGRVTGHFPGSTDLTAAIGPYEATCTVNVSEDLAQAIERNLGTRPSISFSDLVSELNQRSQAKTGSALSAVYGLEVPTKNGILYYNYVSPSAPGHGVGGAERYFVSPGQGQMALQNITFVPKAGYTGTAVIDYTGVGTNGVTFIGTIRITVTSAGDVSYSTAADQPVTFSAGDFSAICQAKTGKAVNYVTFEQPSSSTGTLYYNYSSTNQYSQKVASGVRYYPNSTPAINNVTFVPAQNYTGAVHVTYHCTDSSGSSYTGNVAITVYAPSGSGVGNVEYTTGTGDRFTLNGSDFQTVCRNLTGNNLDYIRFTALPNTADGVLYYNYSNSNSTRVATGVSYYRNSSSSSRYISNITFVPASSYSGTITVPFTGYTTANGTFNGNLVIRVGDEGNGTINYSVKVNQSVTFVASDFNNACQRANNAALNRVSFTLPSSNSGILYYNYVSASATGTRVSSAESYYRSGSPAISSVTFVPANNYNGTVSIPFSGYDVNGGRFSGTVRIRVGSGQDSQAVVYSTVTGGVVRFDAADFNNACRAINGNTLNYVRFDLPSSRYGTLYYQYNTSSHSGTTVSSSTSYYRSGSSGSSRLLSDVTFVAGSVTGTTTIRYTGTDTEGDTYTGTVEINVKAPASSVILYTGSSAPIPFRASDFQSACQSALGTALSYIQFTALPSSGILSSGYVNPTQSGTPVSTGARYYPGSSPDISQIVYRPKAETQGVISIPFTGYDVNGGHFSSSVQISLSNSYCSTPFTDVASGWDWAKPSIEFLRQSGITNGYGNNQFGPGRRISRGEFTLMICRAFQFQTNVGTVSFPDVPASSVYAGAVAAARNLGIVQGENGLFKPNNPITRQSAMTMICRAIQAAGQSLPSASDALLSSFSDGYQVSAFARSSVAALLQLGAVRGTTDMRINPKAAISRAEMAVILHRVLTR